MRYLESFVFLDSCVLYALCFTPFAIVDKNVHGIGLHRSHVSVSAADNGFKFATAISSTGSAVKALDVSNNVVVLSTDPLIYIVPHLLSTNECDMYRQYVCDGRNLTRSNPPQVSLDVQKLWPLPCLSLMAGIPPYFRLLEGSTDKIVFRDVTWAILPTMIVSFIAMGLFGFVIILPVIRKISDISSRTSDAVALNMKEDLHFIGPLIDRATASVYAGHLNRSFSRNNWEAPVVTRYDRGSIFAKHGDASPTRGSEWKDIGGQRLVTCICYLNTLNNGLGGETYFDKLNLRVRPQQGSALFFYPSNATSMEADERTTHESLPPFEEKWIVQLFGRAELVPPPLGLPK